jgi:hypothetical protein
MGVAQRRLRRHGQAHAWRRARGGAGPRIPEKRGACGGVSLPAHLRGPKAGKAAAHALLI